MADQRTHDYCVHMSDSLAESYGGVKRADLPDSAFVFPDERTFPIKTSQDVQDAVNSWGRYKGKHSFEDFKSKLKSRAQAIGASNSLPDKWANEMAPETMMSAFAFIELSQMTIGKPFDAIAPGEFTDMGGRPVVIRVDDLQEYVDNTMAVIESTRSESGEIVGLPIDMMNHDHSGGAGWIIGATLDKARNIVQFAVKWTEAGAQLIRDNTVRFFSPSIDPNQKVAVGGSMTNWPASRNKKGLQLALRPIELSQSIEVIADIETKFSLRELLSSLFGLGGNVVIPGSQLSQRKENEDMATIADLAKTEQGARELAALVEQNTQARVTQLMQAEKTKLHLSELSTKWVGGTKDNQRGLPFKSEELVEFMTSLTDEQQKKAEGIFEKILTTGLVDFQQHGHNGSNDKGGKKQLPAEYSLNLDSGAMKLGDLSNPTLGLGDLEQYDLSKWNGGDNGALSPEQEKIVSNLVAQIVKGGAK